MDISDEEFEKIKKEALEKVKQRVDGIATGFTSLIAAKYAREKGGEKVVLAVPVVQQTFDRMISIISKGARAIGAY
ncbi:MAG: hypothetical protein ACOC4M_06300 [Promethearchaeia archaeon]